jgi:hypothetical protein
MCIYMCILWFNLKSLKWAVLCNTGMDLGESSTGATLCVLRLLCSSFNHTRQHLYHTDVISRGPPYNNMHTM